MIKLYSVSDGPPSLAVRLTLKVLELEYTLQNVDYITGEHFSESYEKLNPQHEIPVLDDNGFILSESIAIMQYLCDKYQSVNSTLYPKDVQDRAIVNQRLLFNSNYYYNYVGQYTLGPIYYNYPRTEKALKMTHVGLNTFNTYLLKINGTYATGSKLTLADFGLIATTICVEAINPKIIQEYTKVKEWYTAFKENHPDLWQMANESMQEMIACEKSPPIFKFDHPYYTVRK